MGRKVVAGQCSTFVQSGRMIVDCVCLRGEFNIRRGGWNGESEEVKCEYCSHDLLDHADVSKREDEGISYNRKGSEQEASRANFVEVMTQGKIPECRSMKEEQWDYDTSSTTGANTPTTSTSGASTPSGTSTAAASIAAETRKVLAGPCAAFLIAGRMKVACVCPGGDFELHDGACADELECRYCCHGLEDHEGFSDLTEGRYS